MAIQVSSSVIIVLLFSILCLIYCSDPVTDVTSAPPTATPVGPQCCPEKTLACQENWYQVDNYTCLLVFDARIDSAAWTECRKRNANSLRYQHMIQFRCCFEHILENLLGGYKEDIVRFSFDHVGIRSSKRNGQYRAEQLACYQYSPAYWRFTLQIVHPNGTFQLADQSTVDVTVNTTSNFFRLWCIAAGVPKPTVVITDESQKRIWSSETFTLAKCSQPAVYTCTAKNLIGSWQSQKTIQIFPPCNGTGEQASPEKESELNALHIALPLIGFIIIVVIIVAIVWCRVKGIWKSRSRADGEGACRNDTDDNGEVLKDNVKETSADKVTEVTEVDHDQETDFKIMMKTQTSI